MQQNNKNSQQQQEVPLDVNQLILSIKYIHNPPNEQSRKDANQYLMDSERNSQYLLHMVQIFETQQEMNVKMTAFINIKNTIQRYWRFQQKKYTNSIFISPEIKNGLREKFIQYLNQIQEVSFRKYLNETICSIVQNDHPNHYQELYVYITQNLQNILQQVQNGQLGVLIDSNSKHFFQTVKLVLREQSKKRFTSQKQMFHNIIQTLMNTILPIWEAINSGLMTSIQGGNSQEIEGFLKLGKTSDKILTSTLICTQNDVTTDERIGEIINKFMLKCQKLLELQNQVSKNQDVLDTVHKSLRTVVNSLSQLQQSFPLQFGNSLNDYLSLLKILISQEKPQKGNNNDDEEDDGDDDNVLKTTLISLMKVLKCFVFYSDSQTYLMSKKQSEREIYANIQQKVNQTFYNFFNQSTLQEIIEIFITKLFPRVISSALTTDIIEQEDETYLEQSDLENSTYNLLMNVTENLFLRFPEQTLQLIKQLIDNLIQNNFQSYNVQIQEGLYAIIGLVPKVAEKNKVDPTQIINILPILEYLYKNQSQNPNFSRRIPILVNRWLKHLNNDIIKQICELIFQILQSNNTPVIKYECCLCIKNIIGSEKCELNFNQLITILAPIIIQLFTTFDKSAVLWPLVFLLSSLLEKSKYEEGNNVLQCFQTTDLNKLILTDSELLKNAFVEMFKNLIVSFPPESDITAIVQLIISFIANSLTKCIDQNAEIDASMLSLWYVLVKEYSPTHHRLDEPMKQLIFTYLPIMSSDDQDDAQIFTDSLYIIEEYVLLGFIPVDQYPNIITLIDQKYKFANQITASYNQRRQYNATLDQQQVGNQSGQKQHIGSEDTDLKTACLNITATLLLIYLNSGQADAIKLFSSILELCIKDLVSEYDQTQKGAGANRTGMQVLINRFLMKYPQDILQYINTLGVQTDQFFNMWILNMNALSSRNSLKINTVTILNVLPVMGENVFKNNFIKILKKIIPDIHNFIEYQQNPNFKQEDEQKKKQNLVFGKRRMTEGEPSLRKDKLRQTQLFNDVNLHTLFKQQIQNVFGLYNVSQEVLQQLLAGQENEGLLQQFMFLVQ